MFLIRSFLFVPGTNKKRIEKALSMDTDAVIIDLEDAVALNEKENARNLAYHFSLKDRKPLLYARTNSYNTPFFKKDIEMIKEAYFDGIMLPKCETGEELTFLTKILPTKTDFIPLIESAKGIINLKELGSTSKNISRFAFGALDYTLDIGANYTKSGRELLYPRSHLVLISKVLGLMPPVDTVFPDLQDECLFIEEIKEAKNLGMFGKLAIHPKQLSLINKNFTPSKKEIEEARRIVEIFEKREKEGIAAIEIDGKFVDYPVFERSKKLLKLYSSLKKGEMNGKAY